MKEESPKYLGRTYTYNLVDEFSECNIKIKNNKYVSDLLQI
jgi:hypothetical protein